ncbi:MAG TPA: AAA family ATPase [Rudaea sp.]|nr:AAA family ATPase [Rudaea sp.]
MNSAPSPDYVGSAVPNPCAEAATFLYRLDPLAQSFQFRTFSDCKPQGPDPLAGGLEGNIQSCWPALAQRNLSGAGVFVVVNSGGQTAREIDRIRAVFVDLDGSPIEPVMTGPIKPHVVVESSNNRWHAYWIVDGMPLPQFASVQKAIAKQFYGDSTVCDLPRVMRVPGFLHCKHETRVHSRLRYCSWRPPYAAAEVLAAFGTEPAANVFQLPAMTAGKTEVADSVIAELRSALLAIPSDDYSDWVAVGHALHELGHVGRGLWLEWSSKSRKFDLEAAEHAWRTFRPERTGYAAVFARAQRLGWKNPMAISNLPSPPPTAARRVSFSPARDLLSSTTSIPWLIENYLSKNSLAALIGAPNCGKTFLALDWACCIATGMVWCDLDIEQGGVFYIVGEGRAGLLRRLRAWEIAKQKSLRDAPLFVSDGAAVLTSPLDASAVCAECERLSRQFGTQPALIVVDTLARNYEGDENSATDMGHFISHLDRFLRVPWGCCVLVVHHVGLGEEAQKRGRGSSALRAALDAEYVLRKKNEFLTLECTKAKDWEFPSTIHLKLKPITFCIGAGQNDEASSCFLDTSDAVMLANLQGMGKNTEGVRRTLCEIYEQRLANVLAAGGSGDQVRVSLAELRSSVFERGVVKDRS